jgi:two-component system chemotaxis sensor kinase CheA
MTGEPNDDSREQFLAEAQELIETLSRDLLLLDQAERSGDANAEVLNDLFRGVHTLKGLAGMFGFSAVARLAHALEDQLQRLRMGGAPLTGEALDLLFHGVERFAQLLAVSADGSGLDALPEGFVERVHALVQADAQGRDVLQDYAFDPESLAALSAYEEHRLRSHIEKGDTVCRFVVALAVDRIDSALAQLKQTLKPIADLLAVLPGMRSEEHGFIEFEVLVATRTNETDLRAALVGFGGNLFTVRKRSGASLLPPAPLARVFPPAPTPAMAHSVIPEPMALALRSPTSLVRVEIRKLDELMNLVGELGTVRTALASLFEQLRTSHADPELISQAQRMERSFGRQLATIQDAVLQVRRVPLSQVFDKLAVVVRNLAREQHKDVQLVVSGERTEVDKLVAEDVADPLVHLVRNAVDHGIESRQERAERGKAPVATVHIHAFSKGSSVVIEVRDDGRGIDAAEIRKAAVESGVVSEARTRSLSRFEIFELLFVPGFSTSREVSDVSGRGVGLDVVKTNLQRIGGSVKVESEAGAGATFELTLPITLAVLSALVFSVRGHRLVVPLALVQEVVRIDPRAIQAIDGRELLDLRGTTLPLSRAADLLRLLGDPAAIPEQTVIVLSVANRRLGLLVDRIHGQREVVVKPLGESLRYVPGVMGATELGDQRLAFVLDAAALVAEVLSPRATDVHFGGVP